MGQEGERVSGPVQFPASPSAFLNISRRSQPSNAQLQHAKTALGPPEEADGVETRGKADVGCWRLCLTVCFCQYFLLFFFGPQGVELLD